MVKKISRAAIIAALYVALTVLLMPISFYAFQVRVAEALTVLPFIFPEAVWGLFIGCLIANFFGGLGILDIAVGSTLTLIAA
ncbi:QueT transporter family protein, partial [candidate division WOR-3 bacterium]|nr:QueT transporter family protein [candidate division WOR-3 bacterium]